MKLKTYYLKNDFLFLFVVGIVFIFLLSSAIPSPIIIPSSNEHMKFNSLGSDSQILYTPEYSKKTYLINNNGDILHQWNSNYIQGMGVHLLDNGDLLRSDLPYASPTFWGGGITGRVEKFSWYGSLLWEFEYSNNQHCLHHDIEPLPNGNVLMIAWDYKTDDEAIQAGKNPFFIGLSYIWPDFIIEVQQTGPSSGEIVWEWQVWDHLIQDFDPSKDNYGIVSEHPELIDINFPDRVIFGDWNHVNSIDYNEEFDQILLSSRSNSEVWVIDHSTTTEEAAGHTGGRYGKGGDLIYRWGNPIAYHAGDIEEQKFFDQHDARWIENGYPGEGNIMVFSNGKSRPTQYSSVDEISPPVDSNGFYSLEEGSAYGPENLTWSYIADNPTDFYAEFISGAQRIYNGNTLICDGPGGIFFEVTPGKDIVWEFVNPYPDLFTNDVFTIQHYAPVNPSEGPNLDCEGSLSWNDVKAGDTIHGSFALTNIGEAGSSLNWMVDSFPNWGTWSFIPIYGENLTPEDGQITVQVTVVAPDKKGKEFTGSLLVQNLGNFSDFEIIPIYLKTPREKLNKIQLSDLLNIFIKKFLDIIKRFN